ncbi:hypothetical protein [Sphingomonas hylomeconis]|uniref:TonB C-terminal domain-containing protein n=1 Tax=Sphingomonas hylomeconis TaxID=1395958 RepID=A0ABV7SWU9_9SPHN|nr:hypothetical protein [Sphingomonas hylomeconis]
MGRRSILMLATIAGMASAAAAQQPASSVQQDFEAAAALHDKDDFAGALARWQALETRAAKNVRSRSLVQLRKGQTLLALDRKDEAVAATRLGLAALPSSDATLRNDRFVAFLTLGRVAEASLDYASAAEAYDDAEKLATGPGDKLIALRGLIQATTFVDPNRAGPAIGRAELLVATDTDKAVKAVIKRLKGQLLLNQGAFELSRKASGEAVQLLGGLTERTRIDDVPVRSNYAIAALLAGDKEDARRYLAMTGAGRLSKGSFDPALQMKVPECGGESGLKPADMAVVEFTIDDDGVVRISAPVYAAGGGGTALEFARATRGWSWSPEQVKQMPLFFRNRVRVELRCSTAFERPSIGTYLDGELGAWLTDRKVAMPPMLSGSDAGMLPQLRVQLAAAEAAGGADALALVPILHQLTHSSVVAREEINVLARRELAIAVAHGAPPPARLAIETIVWQSDLAEGWKPEPYVRTVTPALGATAYAGDAVARSALRLLLADAGRKNETRSRQLLTEIGKDPALPANHPLRVGALIRLASLEKDAGNAAAAAAAFTQSGLSARQCALVDSAPRFLGVTAGPSAFPMEAQQWGFEGFTSTQFDVSADGRVVNQRVVVAYPPFVFTEAGTGIMKTARYEKSYRPEGGLGCGGEMRRVRFSL